MILNGVLNNLCLTRDQFKQVLHALHRLHTAPSIPEGSSPPFNCARHTQDTLTITGSAYQQSKCALKHLKTCLKAYFITSDRLVITYMQISPNLNHREFARIAITFFEIVVNFYYVYDV